MTHSWNYYKILSLVFLLMGAAVLNKGVSHYDTIWVDPPTERSQKMDPPLFKVLTVGHLTAGIDWLLIRSLANSGMGKVPPGTHPSFYYDLDLVSDLDPAFYEVYIIASCLLAVLRGDVEGAETLLQKGNLFLKRDFDSYPLTFKKKFWPYAWNLPVNLAYVYLFGKSDMPRAAESFRQAAQYSDAPDYLLRLEKRLKVPGGEYEVGLKLLNFMMLGARDDKSKQELERKRLDLFISQYLFEINHSFQKYLDTQPAYRSHTHLTETQMQKYWKDFRRTNQIPEVDPWGGRVHLDSVGKVVSTTPHAPVFGLH